MSINKICDTLNCTGCGACVQSCPVSCISMEKNDEGFIFPTVDTEKCTECGKCQKICPANNNISVHDTADFYMAWHKDIEVLKHSSSGGVFTALADYVLSRGGLVAGAEMDEHSREIIHTLVSKKSELNKHRRSKYYQSNTENIYNEIKMYLQQGRYVLFTGTACQIAGLYAVLGNLNDSKFLITADVLCHGVASKNVIDAYIKSKERKYKKKIINYYFRVKNDIKWKSGGYTHEA